MPGLHNDGTESVSVTQINTPNWFQIEKSILLRYAVFGSYLIL